MGKDLSFTFGMFLGSLFRLTLSLISKSYSMFKNTLSLKTWMVQEHKKKFMENCLLTHLYIQLRHRYRHIQTHGYTILGLIIITPDWVLFHFGERPSLFRFDTVPVSPHTSIFNCFVLVTYILSNGLQGVVKGDHAFQTVKLWNLLRLSH